VERVVRCGTVDRRPRARSGRQSARRWIVKAFPNEENTGQLQSEAICDKHGRFELRRARRRSASRRIAHATAQTRSQQRNGAAQTRRAAGSC
jgi:hypothetical protein